MVALSFGSAGILFPIESKIAPWSCGKTLYTPRHPPVQDLLSTDETRLSLLHCRIYTFRFRFGGLSSSSPCKKPKQRAASALFRQRKSCLHATDQSYAQDSANLQQYVLLRNKLVTQVIIRATESFNLNCKNVARQVEGKCCPYYRTFSQMEVIPKGEKLKESSVIAQALKPICITVIFRKSGNIKKHSQTAAENTY